MNRIVSQRPARDWKGSATLAISLCALVASSYSAYVAADSARLSKSSTFVSRRPIVVVSEIWPAEPLTFARLEFKNAGSSPSMDVTVKGKSELRNPAEDPDFDHYSEFQFKGVLGQSTSFEQGIKLPELSSEDAGAIHDQRKALYVHGSIDYIDMWKQKHFLKFCYKLDPLMKLYYSCAKHNEIDS